MKLQLNKRKLKNLSKDNNVLPSDMTPQVGGGGHTESYECDTDTNPGTWPAPTQGCLPDITDYCGVSDGCGRSEMSNCCTTVTIP